MQPHDILVAPCAVHACHFHHYPVSRCLLGAEACLLSDAVANLRLCRYSIFNNFELGGQPLKYEIQ